MEVYPAFQGEGSRVGTYVTFVRLFSCNLRCTWCDTAYSINLDEAQAFFTGMDVRKTPPYDLCSPDQIMTKIAEESRARNVVFSGGEPMLWWERGLGDTVDRLRNLDYHVTIETNGTLVPSGRADLWSVSPKLPGSQMTDVLEVRARVDLQKWADLARIGGQNVQLKFVITEIGQDLVSVQSLLDDVTSFRGPIFLQPNGDWHSLGADGWAQKILSLNDAVKADEKFWSRYDVRILAQQHVLVYGRARYV